MPLARLLVAALVAVPLAAVPLVPAAADTPAAPQLSVTMSNGTEVVHRGQTVTYATTVTNSGSDAVLTRVVADLPDYLTANSAKGAELTPHAARWTETLEPGAKKTFRVSASVGAIPKRDVRVTALASVYLGEEKSPLIRTADADRIPGVADAPTEIPGVTTVVAPRILLTVGGLVVGLALLAAALIVVVRRRRRYTGRAH